MWKKLFKRGVKNNLLLPSNPEHPFHDKWKLVMSLKVGDVLWYGVFQVKIIEIYFSDPALSRRITIDFDTTDNTSQWRNIPLWEGLPGREENYKLFSLEKPNIDPRQG